MDETLKASGASSVRYVPVLKAKDAEYRSLADVKPATKASIVPLLEVPPILWDYEEERPAKGIDAHLEPVVKRITGSWGTAQVAYLDLDLVADETMADGRHPVDALFAEAATAGLQLIPVVGLERSPAYVTAVAAAVARDGRGVCLRLEPDDLLGGRPDPIGTRIDNVLRDVGVGPAEADLVLDLGAIPAGQMAMMTIAWASVLSSLPRLAEWRTFTLAATAFPETLSGFAPNNITPVLREEWQLYQTLRVAGLPRVPDFGDYAIAHPELVEIDPRVMQMSAGIRYTADQEWLVVRGQSVRKHGWGQTRTLSTLLLRRPEARDTDHCWGCDYIHKCAAGAVGPGQATVWRRVGTVHHLTTVVEQLTTLFGP